MSGADRLLSNALAQGMWGVAEVGRRIEQGFAPAAALCGDAAFTGDAMATFREVGSGGGGALEVYETLDDNIATVRAFLGRWERAAGPGYDQIVRMAEDLLAQLENLRRTVDAARPHGIEEIKAGLGSARLQPGGTDEQMRKLQFKAIVQGMGFAAVAGAVTRLLAGKPLTSEVVAVAMLAGALATGTSLTISFWQGYHGREPSVSDAFLGLGLVVGSGVLVAVLWR